MQQAMEAILAPVKRQYILMYKSDLKIFLKILGKHLRVSLTAF